jgi:hypothetical protein
VLVMVDSDMWPDMSLAHGDPSAKPFWDTAFEYLYRHYEKGPVVIGAPYCGPPPDEVVYMFKWVNRESGHPNLDFQIEKYDRLEASRMAGIQECAALPTGLIMYDMRAFELTEPKAKKAAIRDRILFPYRDRTLTPEEAVELADRAMELCEHAEDSWFYYQWKDAYQSEKGSTEDVTATRDMAFHGYLQLGYSPLRCAWDCWAGHWKTKCVPKPMVLSASQVSDKYRRAATAADDTLRPIMAQEVLAMQ